MKIYVHLERRPEAEGVEVASGIPLRALVDQVTENPVVLIEDSDERLDPERTLVELGIAERTHLFVGQRQHVEAAVLFNGETRVERFSASTRVSRVFRWAVGRRAFDLSAADAAEHVLALADDVSPAGDTHLGSLDDATPGHVAFRLIPKHRYEG